MSDPVLLDIENGIAVMTLNRPHQLNALNYELIDRLMALLDRIEGEATIRAVILTGAGERAFSAGADIHQFASSVQLGADIAVRDFVRRGQTMTARLEAFRKPVIAAINGIAFGGGCEITEAVHLAIASDKASFAKPEINLGMPPTFGGTQRLPRLAGRKRALELLLTGEPFPPARAVEIGLINRIVPHDDLLPAARELAARIIRHSPLAIGSIITAVTRGLNMSIGEGLLVESEQFAAMVPTHDLNDGLSAWIGQRRT
jgi:enoyl-CoA hydratase